MVADAFHDGDGARVAHGETLAATFEIGFAGDGAVEHGIADDDVLQRRASTALRRRTITRPPERPLPT